MRRGGNGEQNISSGLDCCSGGQEESELKLKPPNFRVLCEPHISHPCSSDRAAFNSLKAESLGSIYILSKIILAFLFLVMGNCFSENFLQVA